MMFDEKNSKHSIELYKSNGGWEMLHILGDIIGYENPHSIYDDQPSINAITKNDTIKIIDAIKNHIPRFENAEYIINFIEECQGNILVSYSY